MSKYIEWIISFIILLPVSISFCLNPLTNDVRIYQGVAKLSDYFGPFPSNINLAWEIKPIGNRGLNYLLYKISSMFAIFGTNEYELIIKILAVIIVLIICYYFSTKFDNKYLFLLSSLAFLTPLNFICLQAEWWASLFTLLAITLFLTENKDLHYIAGVIITLIFLFKGITILLVIPIICIIYLLKSDWLERMLCGLIGSISSLLIILMFNNLVIPDMILSSQIGPIGYVGLFDLITYMIFFTSTTYVYIPILAVGLISLIFLFYKYMKEKDLNKVIILKLMWVSTLIIILIQSEFFVYHFIVLLVPSIITIILLSNKTKMGIVIILLIFVFFSSHWSYGMNIENKFWLDKNQNSVDIVNNFTDIKNQDYILYLDPGDAPYYFQSNSSCRYICPLPFERNGDRRDLSNFDAYKEIYNCIMNYNGKYIITDAGTWMIKNTTDNKIIWDKINSNYIKVWNNSWDIYMRNDLK